jgi:hypothetical protein
MLEIFACCCQYIGTKVTEYSSMAAPIYASWGFDTDTYYEKNIRNARGDKIV